MKEAKLRLEDALAATRAAVGTEFLSVYYDAVKEYVHMMEGNDKPLKMLEVPEFVVFRNSLKAIL